MGGADRDAYINAKTVVCPAPSRPVGTRGTRILDERRSKPKSLFHPMEGSSGGPCPGAEGADALRGGQDWCCGTNYGGLGTSVSGNEDSFEGPSAQCLQENTRTSKGPSSATSTIRSSSSTDETSEQRVPFRRTAHLVCQETRKRR